MAFSILCWNTLYTNQTGDNDKLNKLKEELRKLIDQYQPDALALSEVVQINPDEPPAIVEFLRELGYKHSHYAQMAHKGDYWMSGVTLCSKFELEHRQIHIISRNGSAARWGYPEFEKENISAAIQLPDGSKINVIVAHNNATIDSLKEHIAGKRSLEKLVRSKPFARNTILLGDMNEWRGIPGSFKSKVKDIMNCKTGSIFNPTWRYNGHKWMPIRANLDYVYWSKQSDFQLIDFKVLDSSVSDHRPLLADFEYVN